MNHPTDPTTPVRALIEAAGKITPTRPIAVTALGFATMDATAYISQLLSEHEKVVEYIKELREKSDRNGITGYAGALHEVAEKLSAIQEGK